MGMRANLKANAEWEKRVKAAEKAGSGVRLRGQSALLFYGIIIEDDQIVLRNKTMALAGARASVDSMGEVKRQFAPAKLMAFGLLGATKKVDARDLVFAIEATDDGVVWKINPDDQMKARQFAMKINTLAKQAEPEGRGPESVGANGDIPDQIRKLAGLRDSGVLTSEEFDAKKTELLSRL